MPEFTQHASVSPTRYNSEGRGTGSGFSRTRSISVNTAVLPPIPSASVSTQTSVKPGASRRRRPATARSAPKPRHALIWIPLNVVSDRLGAADQQRPERRQNLPPAPAARGAPVRRRPRAPPLLPRGRGAARRDGPAAAASRSSQRAMQGTGWTIGATGAAVADASPASCGRACAWRGPARARPAAVRTKCFRVRPPGTGRGSDRV